MPLRVELKPNERVIIGTAVIRNGDQRARFFIEGDAPILREKDILTPESADTPAKRIYLAVQLMYLKGELSDHHEVYFPLVKDFLAAVPRATPIIADVNNLLLTGEFYKALKEVKKLIAFEEEVLSNVEGR